MQHSDQIAKNKAVVVDSDAPRAPGPADGTTMTAYGPSAKFITIDFRLPAILLPSSEHMMFNFIPWATQLTMRLL